MNTPPLPSESEARHRALLDGAWVEGGFVSVLVTQLAGGRVQFTPRVSGARGFVVPEKELIEVLLRWGHVQASS